MEVNIVTEQQEVISSGSIIIPRNDFVEFKIDSLRFRFLLVNRSDEQNGRIETAVETDANGSCMVISLINFASSFFASSRMVLPLARLGDKELGLRFSITSINQSEDGFDGLFFYTWLISKGCSDNGTTE